MIRLIARTQLGLSRSFAYAGRKPKSSRPLVHPKEDKREKEKYKDEKLRLQLIEEEKTERIVQSRELFPHYTIKTPPAKVEVAAVAVAFLSSLFYSIKGLDLDYLAYFFAGFPALTQVPRVDSGQLFLGSQRFRGRPAA